MKHDLQKGRFALMIMMVTALMLGMASCQKENLDINVNEQRITVDQARASFENELSNYGEEGSDLLGLSASVAAHADDYAISFDLNPGEYTPVWDKAHINPTGRKAAVSTPIIPEYCYVALREYYEQDSVIRTTAVLAFQKLVALRTDAGDVRNYIATIVPTEEYYLNNQAIDVTFNYGDDVDNFSGLVYYHTLDGAFYEIQKYVNGTITKRLNITEKSDENLMAGISSIGGDIYFSKIVASMTYTKGSILNWDFPESPQPGVGGGTLSQSQMRCVLRNIRAGTGSTVNLAPCFYDQNGHFAFEHTSGLNRTSPTTISDNGYSVTVRSMSAGFNKYHPSLEYKTSHVMTESHNLSDGRGGVIPHTTYIFQNTNGLDACQIRVVIPNSQRGTFYKMMGWENGIP